MPLITLTTDFGTKDHFAGVIKGVIAGIAPNARVVDITHEITPYDLNEGAFVIAEAWRWFPKGTIHVAVVDPGVGSARRPIVVEAGGHRFVGPDNGVFTPVYAAGPHKIREIENSKLMLPYISRTFHGRDIFAPAAAHLANGVALARFGKWVRDPVLSAVLEPVKKGSRCWSGRILKVDRFGNLITNFRLGHRPDIGVRRFELRIGSRRIARLARNYAETEMGEVFAIEGSSGYLEISANQDSAALKLGCGPGAPVDLEIL
ncbi:MAG: SAM-dependent chlorinase/fluorinase [Bryobacterales bacterium]|nr:SAM-dependent chlorinase/fluorinase [Bryobacterales bacterium]MBV9401792.1 SAM-dependent chlorinase/fluorinase [Bryobacterales bacterium]